MEIWHPCAGFETHYEVSNFGSVRSIARSVPNRWENSSRVSPAKTLRPGKSKNGYLTVNFCVDGIKSNQNVHRLVARAFIPNESNKPQVNHKDGNKHNNHVHNLEWVTVSENGLHAYRVLKISVWNKGRKCQELSAKNDALEARLAALEAK
jgi:hypothetical protein